ncbi:PHD FINGER-LIKE DOMAIN-CONTAINING PROTEIN 5A [Salix viminalis]|uniref:PHD FINGER-LIKE DOMAIN-CONTAINING PROTEIN 5A n=1 Tax=Salix viminalis TaxID=40686 RepID=A0A9Q0NJQ3_SALVM|nr:PHD FINGER-LIKE DOMAIN-CONTAINING PROTEIN 5A [Salix viminalis]
MAKHQPDLIMCRKQPGIAIGRLCEKDDGKCVICDSLVHPCTLVRICDECNYGSFQGRCVICGGVGISDAYYCKECTQLEKDRDGCPKIVNLGSAKTDLFYEGPSTNSKTERVLALPLCKKQKQQSQIDSSSVGWLSQVLIISLGFYLGGVFI